MFAVDFFWTWRPDASAVLILANVAIDFVCLGISAPARVRTRLPLLSIYPVSSFLSPERCWRFLEYKPHGIDGTYLCLSRTRDYLTLPATPSR